MDYDVIILGGGIVGCAVSYELSKYNLNIALIEKDYDIADDVAFINSSVVYDGLECEDTLLAKLELMGNKLMPELASKFDIGFKKKGYLLVANSEKSEKKLIGVYDRALKRGIENIYLLDAPDIHEVEPNLSKNARKAIYSKNTGIISPYDLAISYGEIAFDNGVNFKLGEEVLDIKNISKGFKVVTNKNKFTCNMVLNTTPAENYSIDSKNKINRDRKYMKYFLLGENTKRDYKNIVSMMEENNEKIYTMPTIKNGLLIGIGNHKKVSYEKAFQRIKCFMKDISEEDVEEFYESLFYNDSLIIDDSLVDKGYIKVIGKHYGQITAAPVIATIVCETIVNNLNCILKKDFVDRRREFYRFRDLSNESRKKIIKLNKNYGRIICYCEKVTEGEIIDAIRRPLGARTIEGIKRRTGAGFGNCNGSQCICSIASILSREINKDMTYIVKDSKNSNIVKGRIKEFDEM
ncbi:NAD(P)/FAD-dependent oxidoreductase [Clostridium luticellarii]|jgi:L-2-hydroxyglutarate oxidase LhgO|uniref:NAD(P)/FAD-dependent oxidoreductase n=1 Tax=Clostridium luticellarii TaxID=1691940 RepID=UPI002354B267|nr:FAD-dependent oxidoreductase [Clostridium luticellarii]MCI1946350.1 FAD-dependent oxidoreductase [Clostridium luticellarii]MCI1969583.1 FAD-dependent oxidoreductase [Clostridium luticellarii]MCI1996754.1 FAD-dependent oxidoreductase [Clostridium luticellarii]